MCNPAGIDFVVGHADPADIRGKRVLEVGALDVNGSVRAGLLRSEPATYVGVDIVSGLGVDELCDARDLIDRYGRDSFDVVVSTELLEHILDWRTVVSNLKGVLAPGGVLFITTRSFGYPYHGAPRDYWRFEPADIQELFADLSIDALMTDPSMPGVFLMARKPTTYRECEPLDIALYSMVAQRRTRRLSLSDRTRFVFSADGRTAISTPALRVTRRVTPRRLRRWVRKHVPVVRS